VLPSKAREDLLGAADPMAELRALDEMERLALTQVAAARQRKREILLTHGIPIARRTTAKMWPAPQLVLAC
jgi:hypothetical protein